MHGGAGAAGFVGSSRGEALLGAGHDVVGIDSFTDYYETKIKRRNIAAALANQNFRLLEVDLRTADLEGVLARLDDISVVYHQAGQPGVRLSWDEGFATYNTCNILATQRLLEACKRTDVPRVVYASSSSVYGNAKQYPVTEGDLPAPHSPYGVTKLAAEHLCSLYVANHGLSVMSLRYFTVYGPRQRPDMAFSKLIRAAIEGSRFPLLGDGSQVRDFTYVGDVVAANLTAGESAQSGCVNICGGGSTKLRDVFDLVEENVGKVIAIDAQAQAAGDVDQTGGSFELAREIFGWTPKTALADGIAAQCAWTQEMLSAQ